MSRLNLKVTKVLAIIGTIFGFIAGFTALSDGKGFIGFIFGIFFFTLLGYLIPFIWVGTKKWFSLFNNGCLINLVLFFCFPYIIAALAVFYAFKGLIAIINKESYIEYDSSSGYNSSSSYDKDIDPARPKCAYCGKPLYESDMKWGAVVETPDGTRFYCSRNCKVNDGYGGQGY